MSARGAVPRWLVASAAGAALFVMVTVLFLAVRPGRTRSAKAVSTEIEGVVTVEVADLKREPSEKGAAAGALPRGTRVSIVGHRGEWLEIKSGKETAFASASAVETDADRQSREERGRTILAFKPLPGLVAEDTDVLLGSFPSAPRAGRLRRGTAVPVYAVDHDYYAVKSDEGVAFVRSADIDLVPPDPKLPAIVPAAGKTIKDLAISDSSSGSSETSAEGSPAGPPGTPAPPHSPPLPGSTAGGELSAVSEEPIEPAALISKVDPAYPVAARQAGVEGTVVLDAEISETGDVVSVTVERGLPMGVSEAAVAAVQRWRYRPARGRMGPVPSHKTVRIQFTLGE